VEKEKIVAILEAARFAPSGHNDQPWKFVLVRNKETLGRLALASDDQNFVAEADSVICCCATTTNYLLQNEIQGYSLDLATSIAFMMLQATDLELGSCWIGAFNETKVKKLLRIPDQVKVISLLTVGYAHYVPPPTARKEMSEVVAAENYNEPCQWG